MKIHLIMPMGGKGSRFFNDGYDIPKPMINIKDKPFLYWSTKSISDHVELIDLTFVVLKEHIDHYHIDKVIHEYFPEANIVTLDHVLNGAVLTCLEGIKDIDDDYPVLFNDCDHMFRSKKFEEQINNENTCNTDGLLLTFESDENKYSYAKLDENGNVIETVEKKVVSNQAICGSYLFKTAQLFKEMAKYYLDDCSYSEYYISGVYNEMIKRGCCIRTFLTDYHIPFGTPKEYQEALSSKYFEAVE